MENNLIHIGVDARALSDKITGIGRYSYELLYELQSFSNVKLSLYSPYIIEKKIRNVFGNSFIRSSFFGNRFTKFTWSQSILPFWAFQDNIDLFWGPTHRLPLFLSDSIPKVVTIHDLVWKEVAETMRPLSYFIEKNLVPYAIKRADILLTGSNSTANGIREYFPQFSNKIRVIPLGSTKFTNLIPTISPANFGIHRPFFLFVGTIEPRKNLKRLLEAFASLPPFYKDNFSLVIAGGNGWGDISIESLIKINGLENSVSLLGYVNDHQLKSLYQFARFLVMPSLYEGFGLPIVEAMQFGLPILTSNNSSMQEIVGDAGLLIDPYCVVSIARGLERLLSDDNMVLSLKKNAVCEANHFSWKNCAYQTFNIFKEVIQLKKSMI